MIVRYPFRKDFNRFTTVALHSSNYGSQKKYYNQQPGAPVMSVGLRLIYAGYNILAMINSCSCGQNKAHPILKRSDTRITASKSSTSRFSKKLTRQLLKNYSTYQFLSLTSMEGFTALTSFLKPSTSLRPPWPR